MIAPGRWLGPPALVAALVVSMSASREAAAAEPPPATPRAVFALIIGVNASPARPTRAAEYADDDAARYLDLFRGLGARAYLLSRLDDNTRRLHPQAAAEALPPRRAELKRWWSSLVRDIGQARARGVPSSLYVIYAGHGDDAGTSLVADARGGRLVGRALLSEVVGRAGADQVTSSSTPVTLTCWRCPRGPGGERRPGRRFRGAGGGSREGRVGTCCRAPSPARATSGRVRGGGLQSRGALRAVRRRRRRRRRQVTYPEIAAFVARANRASR